MATQVQFRGGTTSEHSTFTGVAREVTVDTTKKTVVVHDGSTAGGIPLAKESAVTSAAAITGGSINGTTVGASTASTGAFTTLSASSTVSGAGFSTYLASPPAIGGTTASTGRFTTVTATGLTSGRVTYAGASGLLSDSANLVWDNANTRLGIGTASPTARLNVVTASDTPLIVESTGGSAYVVIQNSSSTAGAGVASNGDSLLLFTSTSGTERMRITSAGNVGIGTTIPYGLLNIKGSNGQLVLANGNTAGGMKLTATDVNYTANGYLAFEGYSSEYARFNSSGQFGIGTSSPSQLLHLNVASGAVYELISSGSNNLYLGYENTRAVSVIQSNNALVFDVGSGYTERMRIDSSGNVSVNNSAGTRYVQLQPDGSIRSVHSNGGGGDSVFSAITGISNGYQISVTAGNAQTYKWHNGGTQSMTLDSSGNLLVGTTSATGGYICTVGNNAKFAWTNKQDTATGAIAGFYNSSGTNIGTITTDNSNTSYNTTSDYRLKENILPMTGALAKLAQLNPVTYKWKTDGSDGQGFIAHELAEVIPDCVTGEKDAVNEDGKPKYQGIDTSYLVATLVSAIQEQQALIESLTTRLTALESK